MVFQCCFCGKNNVFLQKIHLTSFIGMYLFKTMYKLQFEHIHSWIHYLQLYENFIYTYTLDAIKTYKVAILNGCYGNQRGLFKWVSWKKVSNWAKEWLYQIWCFPQKCHDYVIFKDIIAGLIGLNISTHVSRISSTTVISCSVLP